MEVAITAALGLAGILAAFFAPTWADRKIARRREEKELQQARRLVAQELQQVAIELLTMAKQGVGATRDGGPFLVSDEWEAHKATLARDLDQYEWRLVANVYTHVSQFQQLFSLGPPMTLSQEQVFLLVDVARRAHSARDKLAGPREYPTIVPNELVDVYERVPSAAAETGATAEADGQS